MKLAINALRAKSGGAKSHIKGILKNVDPLSYGFRKIKIWTYKELASELPKISWLEIKYPPKRFSNLLMQLIWELFVFPKVLKENQIDILFNLDAGSLARYKCSVTMSQDMLSYENGEIQRYGLTTSALRLFILRYVQNNSLKTSDGVIFLTNYASKVIQKSSGKIKNFIEIPHGVSEIFKNKKFILKNSFKETIKVIYVSNAAPYKHQWHVVNGIKILLKQGYKIKLLLVGGVDKISESKLRDTINTIDKKKKYIFQYPQVNQEKLSSMISSCDIFVFASSCENMPITLLEGMSIGIPIACSNRGPMPEILQDAGIYFDPENPKHIAKAIKKLIESYQTRKMYSNNSKKKAKKYTWEDSANSTFNYLSKIATQKKQGL